MFGGSCLNKILSFCSIKFFPSLGLPITPCLKKLFSVPQKTFFLAGCQYQQPLSQILPATSPLHTHLERCDTRLTWRGCFCAVFPSRCAQKNFIRASKKLFHGQGLRFDTPFTLLGLLAGFLGLRCARVLNKFFLFFQTCQKPSQCFSTRIAPYTGV